MQGTKRSKSCRICEYFNTAEAKIRLPKSGSDMTSLLKLTGVEHITATLVAFSRLSRVHFCKASALLQIARFDFRKKATKICSST